jgi:hypothetical protein
MIYSCCRNQNRPSTPEGERSRIRAADRLERLQMTNPDERRSRIRLSTQSENIVPLNYGAALAAQIPQVQLPDDWNAPSKVLDPDDMNMALNFPPRQEMQQGFGS